MMKIRDGFIRKTIAGSEVVLAVGEAAEHFNGTITLNDSGKLLWEALEAGCDMDGLVQKLLEVYDVDEGLARADAEKFVANLKKYNIVVDPDADGNSVADGANPPAGADGSKPKHGLFGKNRRS